MGTFEIGTIIQDQGKVGIIRNIVEPNSKLTGHSRLVIGGYIEILYNPNDNNKLIDSLDN